MVMNVRARRTPIQTTERQRTKIFGVKENKPVADAISRRVLAFKKIVVTVAREKEKIALEAKQKIRM